MAGIIYISNCTKVPGSAGIFIGITSVRGTFYNLFDPKPILGFPKTTDDAFTYALLLKNSQLALAIDAPDRIVQVSEEDYATLSDQRREAMFQYSRGIIMGNIIELDVDKILAHPDLQPKYHKRG